MKTALLIIDIQNDYFPGGKMELEESVQAASAAARLLGAFRREKWPIYHVQHVANRPGVGFFIQGSQGADIYEAVRPAADEPVIIKHLPNSFRDTGLLEMLKGEGIKTLLVCGMMTHMCIDATVRAAFDLGFSCTVVHDACATRALAFNGNTVPAKQVQASFLAALAAVYAQIKGVDDIMQSLESTH